MPLKYRNEFFDEPRDPSRIKLRIYQKYLVPWASKVGSPPRESKIWVVDGFAGPGTYRDEAGTPGSPKLILDHARQTLEKGATYRIGCIFVEKKMGNWRELKSLCAQYEDVGPQVIHGDFWEQVDRLADLVKSMPLLLITDPFGVKGIDYEKLAHLANASSKCDVIVTFVSGAVPRLEAQYPQEVEKAIGPKAATDNSPAETFARNLSAAARFLPGGHFPLQQSFDSTATYELIVFSRSVHAYQLWNGFVTRESQDLRKRSRHRSANEQPLLEGFTRAVDEAAAEEGIKAAANEILEWTRSRRSFSRREMTDHFVVYRFGAYHSSTLHQALRLLESRGRLVASSTRADADTRPWRAHDQTPL